MTDIISSPTKKRSNPRLDRRAFLQAASAVTATSVTSGPAFLRAASANDKLNIAIIGSGGRGAGNTAAVSSENIVALCDVDENRLNAAGEKYPHARKLTDFRGLYDHADEFDAVVVSTCEHTHAFATLPALRMGKHVYCEKPLTHSTWESRVIREAAGEAQVATQMGTQIHASNNYRRVVELVQSGVIGPVHEAHVWVSRAWGRHASAEDAQKANDIYHVDERPAESQPIPAGLDWDLWLGPAPERPFHEAYFPGPRWYRWWDFGNGTMSDLGSHHVDLSFWALELDYPLTIEASGPAPHAELAPASMQVTYEYGPRGDLPEVKLTWYQGQNKPAIWTEAGIPQWADGTLFVGQKGMLLANYGEHMLLPEEQWTDFEPPAPFIPNSLGHHAEWIHACKTGAPTTCNFEYAGWLTEANHLGNVAFRSGKKLFWDPVKLQAIGTPEADPFIRREYREGWDLV